MKQQQLLEIIKEELILKNQQVHVDKVIPLVKTDFVYQVIDKNLPIYEDQLKQILFEQSKESIGKVICDLEYKQKIREMQDELEKQILMKKTARQKEKQTQNFKKLKTKLEAPPIQNIYPPNQVQLLQQNLTQLVMNFTSLIAAQVNNPIQKQKHKKSHKSKQHDEVVNKEQIQNTIKFPLNKPGFQHMQQQSPEKQSTQKNFQNISSSSSNSLNNLPSQPRNYQPITEQPVNKRDENKQSPQQFNQSVSQHEDNDDFEDYNDNTYQPSSFVDRNRQSRQPVQQNKRPQTPQFELTPQKDEEDLYNSDYIDEMRNSKVPVQSKQIENLSSVSQEYPDDFIEESQQQLSQVQSNFFKKKAEQSKAVEQFDYDDDIEDLLI